VLLLLPDGVFTLRRLIMLPVFGLVVLWAVRQAPGSVEKMLRTWAVVMVAFALLLMPVDRVWYLIPLIGVLSLVRMGNVVVMGLILSTLALLIHMMGEVVGPIGGLPVIVRATIWYVPSGLALLWMGRTHIRELLVNRTSILQWGRSMHATTTLERGR
jgi:hypothetical protein